VTPTATATAPEHAAFAGLDERFERLPLAQIVASKTNPRTHFSPGYLTQLADSLRDKGCIEPIVVRPLDILRAVGLHPEAAAKNGAKFEIVAGECRYRAAKLATLTHLPAVIRAYSDEQVLELQLIENLHRQDLTPLEQARGYRQLIDTNPDKHSAESIATRLGMSPAWVWDRMKLNDLVPEAKGILDQELMTVGHAILIARLKPADQLRVIAFDDDASTQYRGVGLWRHDSGFDFDEDDPANKGKKPGKYDGLKPCSVRELEAWIHDHIRFDVAHMAKAQPLAFEPTAAAVATAEEKPGRGKKIIPITFSYRVSDDARDETERTYGSESWERADGKEKSKTCEHSVLGVVVAGSQHYGQTFEVCVARDKCRVHFGDVIRKREKNEKLRESGKGKQAARTEKKQAETYNERWKREADERKAEEARWDKLRPAALAAVAAKVQTGTLSDKALGEHFAELLEQASDLQKGDDVAIYKLLGGRVTAKTFLRGVRLIEIFERAWDLKQFKEPAKKYGVDLAKLEKELQASGLKGDK
jgi:ParB/RepB/Spo0J family partition protein